MNSPVKFANFFLVIDGFAMMSKDVDMFGAYRIFLSYLRSKFTVGKGGDTAFKQLPDGSFFNAYNTIGDSFRFIEEAIMASNANNSSGARPTTEGKSTGRAATALSGNSKSARATGAPIGGAADTTIEGSVE